MNTKFNENGQLCVAVHHRDTKGGGSMPCLMQPLSRSVARLELERLKTRRDNCLETI